MKVFVYGSLVENMDIPDLLRGYKRVDKKDRDAVGIRKSKGYFVLGQIRDFPFYMIPYLLYREGVPFHYYPKRVTVNQSRVWTFVLRERMVKT